MRACASMDEALAMAYRNCGTNEPKVIIMPHGAHTWPIVSQR